MRRHPPNVYLYLDLYLVLFCMWHLSCTAVEVVKKGMMIDPRPSGKGIMPSERVPLHFLKSVMVLAKASSWCKHEQANSTI